MMPQNKEGSRMEWIYILVPQTRLTQTKKERGEERDNKKSSKQFKYIQKYTECKERMHENA